MNKKKVKKKKNQTEEVKEAIRSGYLTINGATLLEYTRPGWISV